MAAAGTPWTTHRRRAEELRERYPFAAEVLCLYIALLDVWESDLTPDAGDLAGWAAEHVAPRVVAATAAAGPEPLAKATQDLLDTGVKPALASWLAGEDLPPVERYLARASLHAALVADPPFLEANRDGRHCPRCGGLPQVSFRTDSADPLVSGHRELGCARCAHSWVYSGSACPSCGETAAAKRTVYSEHSGRQVVGPNRAGDELTFPQLRVEACASCQRYLIDVDLGRDPRAVPVVDELAALPLDLYAVERGISKITPNLMGF